VITPYPLLFKPILLDKVWGGRRLSQFGKQLPDGKQIGESWELADLAATSASGAGGGSAQSVIANGPLAGKTLHDAIGTWRRDLLGEVSLSKDGGFPLLVKFLDARDNLSVQVHPSPAYAAANEGANLKTECWYILAAEPVDGKPAVIYKGIKPGVTRETFAKHIADGTVVDDLCRSARNPRRVPQPAQRHVPRSWGGRACGRGADTQRYDIPRL
jgi:mannose-6-phosphate isomerase